MLDLANKTSSSSDIYSVCEIHADMRQTMHNKCTITLSMRRARDEQHGERESVAECLALHEKLSPGWLSAVDSLPHTNQTHLAAINSKSEHWTLINYRHQRMRVRQLHAWRFRSAADCIWVEWKGLQIQEGFEILGSGCKPWNFKIRFVPVRLAARRVFLQKN